MMSRTFIYVKRRTQAELYEPFAYFFLNVVEVKLKSMTITVTNLKKIIDDSILTTYSRICQKHRQGCFLNFGWFVEAHIIYPMAKLL